MTGGWRSVISKGKTHRDCGPEYWRDTLLEWFTHTHGWVPWPDDLTQILPWPQTHSEFLYVFGSHTRENGHSKIRIRTQPLELFFMPRAIFFFLTANAWFYVWRGVGQSHLSPNLGVNAKILEVTYLDLRDLKTQNPDQKRILLNFLQLFLGCQELCYFLWGYGVFLSLRFLGPECRNIPYFFPFIPF